MRIKEILAEAPIDNWTVDPNFDANEREMVSKFHGYRNEVNHYSDADKKAMNDPATIEKVKSAFLKTPYHFNIYFWQSTIPNYDSTLEIGEVTDEWMIEKFGQDVFDRLHSTNWQSAINVVHTNNLSDENYVSFKSPWIMGHRIAHTLINGRKRNSTNDYNGKIFPYFRDFVHNILKDGYGFAWADPNSSYGHEMNKEYMEIIAKHLGGHLGTMRSARNKKLVQESEWYYETFTQYLLVGKITFNKLPEDFDGYYKLTTDPIKRRKVLKRWANFPRRLESLFDKMLQQAVGKFWVM